MKTTLLLTISLLAGSVFASDTTKPWLNQITVNNTIDELIQEYDDGLTITSETIGGDKFECELSAYTTPLAGKSTIYSVYCNGIVLGGTTRIFEAYSSDIDLVKRCLRVVDRAFEGNYSVEVYGEERESRWPFSSANIRLNLEYCALSR